MQRRLLAGGMSFAVAPSSKEPLLVQRVQRKEVFLVAADLAVVPAEDLGSCRGAGLSSAAEEKTCVSAELMTTDFSGSV